MNVLVFDIETIPNLSLGRRLFDLKSDMKDEDVAEHMKQASLEKRGTEFLPIHWHQVVAISAVMYRQGQCRVWSLGDESSNEADLVQRFFGGIDQYAPTLVSWNGAGFDLPVLHYRAMEHQIAAPRHWDMGERNNNTKWNNYISRYHQRHIDVMDLVALYQSRAYAPLDELAMSFGYPGKMGMSGAKVWDYYHEGKLADIRHYCETDVLNTFLVYLRFEVFRSNITVKECQDVCNQLREYLAQQNQPHFDEFLSLWKDD